MPVIAPVTAPIIAPVIASVTQPLIEPMGLTFRQRWRYGVLKAWAMLLLTTGQRVAALHIFGQLLLLHPTSRYALASQAHVQMQLHQTDAAIVTLQRLTAVIGSQIEQAAAWFNLGFALQQAELTNAAGEAFENALAFDARLDRAWYGLGLVRMAQCQFHAAVKAFEKNTRLQPMSPHGWYRLVQSWLALGETAKAVKVVAHLRRFEPRVAAQLERENSGLLRFEQHQSHQLQQPPRLNRSALAPETPRFGARDAAP